MKRRRPFPYFLVVVSATLLSGCASARRPVAPIVPATDPSTGCVKPTQLVGLNKNQLEIASLNIGKFALGKIDYKSQPEVVEVMTKASGDLLVVDYLICVAKARRDIAPESPEQINHLRNLLVFIQGKPTAEQIADWQQKNPFPKTANPDRDSVQVMKDSPGGVQIGRDLNVNVNTERRMSSAAADVMINGLKRDPCTVTIGVLGTGGEPDRLANEILAIARRAGGEVRGVYHGIGFEGFTGVQIKHSIVNTPKALMSIIDAFEAAKIGYIVVPDGGQPAGSLYIYVGYQP